jgi:hypothetical protein
MSALTLIDRRFEQCIFTRPEHHGHYMIKEGDGTNVFVLEDGRRLLSNLRRVGLTTLSRRAT